MLLPLAPSTTAIVVGHAVASAFSCPFSSSRARLSISISTMPVYVAFCDPSRRRLITFPGQMRGKRSCACERNDGGRSFSSALKASTVRLLFSSVWMRAISSSISKMLALIFLLLNVCLYIVHCIASIFVSKTRVSVSNNALLTLR